MQEQNRGRYTTNIAFHFRKHLKARLHTIGNSRTTLQQFRLNHRSTQLYQREYRHVLNKITADGVLIQKTALAIEILDGD